MKFQPLVLIADSSLATQSNMSQLISEQAVLNNLVTLDQLDYWRFEPKQSPDLLIIDSGFLGSLDELFLFLEQWHGHPSTRRCDVIITGHMTPDEEAHFLNFQKVVDCLPKPLNPLLVQARIELRLRQLKTTRELESMSFTDSLTQIANRRYLQDFVTAEWKRASREGGSLGFVMADIDYFKLLNDRYGHPYGDSCLQKASHALKNVAKRPRDLVARYGGEEFACVLPNIQTRGLMVVAKRMLESIHDLYIPHAASPISSTMTISIGVAWAVPTYSSNMSVEHLIEAADKSLYEVKHTGRNNVGRLIEVSPQKSLI